MEDKQIKIFCDGGARGNPGPAAGAFVCEKMGKIIASGSIFLGKSTNNVAEYSSVLLGIKWLKDSHYSKGHLVIFVLDSELVMKQLNNLYKVKDEKLRQLYYQIKELEKNILSKITYTHVLRHKNKMADHLVNKCLDEKNFT